MYLNSFFFILFLAFNLYANTTNNKNVSLQLSWLHQFQFAGYYVAKEKGFYEDVGLNVTIKEFNFKLDIQNVLENKESHFVVGRTSFIIDKIAGKNLVALAAIFQHSPLMLLVRKDSNINNVTDLRNKNMMITGDAKNTAAILAMLYSQKVNLEDMNIQAHSFNLNDLINKKTDAMASYVSNEPIRLKEKNIPYHILHPKDYGFDFYGGMLFTSKDMITTDPDSVKAFHDATIKGWNYAFENIEKSAQIIFNKYNTQNKSLEYLIKEGEILKTLAYDENGKIGTINKQRIKEIANVFLLMGFINKDYSLNDFIYEYNGTNKNRIYLTKKEKEWLEKHPYIIYSGTTWAPIHTYSNDGLEGIAEDILRLIAKNTNINIVFEKKKDWSEVLTSIKNKTLDFALATGETKDKKKYGLFTKPYASFPLVIATKNDVSFIHETAQLNEKIVAVGENYTAHEFLRDYYPKIKLLVVKNSDEALVAVSNNEAFAMVDILPVVAHKIHKLNLANLKISGNTEYNFDLSTFVRNDYPQLVSILNKGIESIKEEEKKQILSKWLSVEYVSKVDYFMIVKVILFFTLLIIVIIYLQNLKLKRSNNALQITLKDLKETREDLVTSEKMATLGELVGGVTHEVSTPLSIGIMGGSYIKQITQDINKLYDNDDISEEEFKKYIKDVSETSKSITVSLERAKILVNSFKQVAVDQAIEDKRDFNVKQYIDEIIVSLTSTLRRTKHEIIIDCNENIMIDSYPGYIAQILINLINNSILHAFDSHQAGKIRITVKDSKKELELIYSDDGKGINKQNQEKIFNQYFTTKKGNGGTGLGLHIVKTIVENKLKGNIYLESEPGHGVCITIVIPK